MLNQDQLNKIIAKKVGNVSPTIMFVVAVRGSDGHNDLGVFDDKVYIVYDHALKGSWNWNTDPSSDVVGRAHLLPGVYDYQAGKHHIAEAPPLGRAAFIQAGPVKIHRTGMGNEEGYFGINLHDATGGTTSSLGCQTAKQYGGVMDFKNNVEKNGMRDVGFRILGVTPEQVMANPTGCGPKFKYILVTGDEANHLLAS